MEERNVDVITGESPERGITNTDDLTIMFSQGLRLPLP